MSDFSAALVTAAAKPEESTRLQAGVSSAKDLAGKFNDLSRQVQQARTDAESRIESTVSQANASLRELEDLNKQIVKAESAGHPTASFEDQRRTVIDTLAEIVPVRLAQRDNGAVAIYTESGTALLDGRAATLSFQRVNLVTADMTLENGLLNGLEINGKSVQPSGDGSPIRGGTLAARFEVRDRLATDVQTQLDAIARDIVERFQSPGLDATRNPGDAGLFTDDGARFDPADEAGLAGRLAVNTAVDPGSGGALWRLRDGLGAATPGAPGNAALLHDLADTLGNRTALASGGLGATSRSAEEHLAAMTSHVGQQRLATDRDVSFASSRQSALTETELSQGVDSDAEMQKLLLVEQAYNANARMIATVDEMIDTLLRI